MRLFSLVSVAALLAPFALGHAEPATDVASADPAAPALTFLYTAYVQCSSAYAVGQTPHGNLNVIPIIGGNFTGPKLSGS
jgi:hypothetical protein